MKLVNIIINITEFSTDLFYRIDIVLTLYHAHPKLQLNPWMMTSNSVTSSLLKTSFWQRCSVKLRVNSYFNKPQEHIFLPWTLIVRYVWSIFSNFVFQFKIKKIQFSFVTSIHYFDLFGLITTGLFSCISLICTFIDLFICNNSLLLCRYFLKIGVAESLSYTLKNNS